MRCCELLLKCENNNNNINNNTNSNINNNSNDFSRALERNNNNNSSSSKQQQQQQQQQQEQRSLRGSLKAKSATACLPAYPTGLQLFTTDVHAHFYTLLLHCSYCIVRMRGARARIRTSHFTLHHYALRCVSQTNTIDVFPGLQLPLAARLKLQRFSGSLKV